MILQNLFCSGCICVERQKKITLIWISVIWHSYQHTASAWKVFLTVQAPTTKVDSHGISIPYSKQQSVRKDKAHHLPNLEWAHQQGHPCLNLVSPGSEGYHGRRQAVGVCQGGCYASVFPIGGHVDKNDFLDFWCEIQNSSALSKFLGIAFLTWGKGNGNKNIFPAFWEREQVFWSKDTAKAFKCSWQNSANMSFHLK